MKKSLASIYKSPAFCGLCFSLLFPSVGVLRKYLGIKGIITYVIIGVLILSVVVAYEHVIFAFVKDDRFWWFMIPTFAGLLAIFLIVYPMANSGRWGMGSDSDDALNMAATSLLHGHYPYYGKTYLGNPISPMPGSILLAIPFVLIGNEAYQNIFWLFLAVLAAKTYLQSPRQSLILFWVMMAISPRILHVVVTGSDEIANTLYVLLSMAWLITAASQEDTSKWKKISSGRLCGYMSFVQTEFCVADADIIFHSCPKRRMAERMRVSAYRRSYVSGDHTAVLSI